MDSIEDEDTINYDFLQSVDVIFQLWIKEPEEFEQKLSDIIYRLLKRLKHLDQQNVSKEIMSYIIYLYDEMSEYHVNIIDYIEDYKEISEIDDNIGNTAEELSLWLDNSLFSRRSKIMIENHNYNNIIQDCLIYSINEIQKTAEVVGCIFEKPIIIIPTKINHESGDYTVIGIHQKAFKKTQNIKTIQFPVDSELITIGKRAFYHSQIECISIPVNLQEIHEEAFFYCEKLHEINIPINSKLKFIGQNAFFGCPFESINIPSSLIKIDKRAFYFCYKLKQVDIKNDSNLQIIEKEAFAYSSIESISISANIKELKDGCFKETPKLNKINVSPYNQFYTIYENNFVLSKSSPKKEFYDTLVFSTRDIESVIIPDFIEVIAKYAFDGCKKIRNIEIPVNSKLQIIEINAFSSSSIEKIILPYHLKKICRHSFAFCNKLQNVEIHSNSQLQIIEKEAFHHSNIEILSFPTSLPELQEGWCIQTKKLVNINMMQNNNKYVIYDNKFVLGKSSPENDKYDVLIFAFRNITEAIIPDFIEVIGSYAFEGCSKLMNVEIRSNSRLREIGTGAFSASAIECIKIPLNLIRIYEDAFYSCTKLHTVDIPKDSKLILIGARAFYNTSVKSIYIPANLTEINEYSFYKCKNLQTVEFGINSKLTVIKKYAFTCASIENIIIPPSVINICKASFYNCRKLTHVEIPKESNLQMIDNIAFSQTLIKTIMIPIHVRKIGYGAFYDCEFLQIDLSPDSELQIICIDAFAGSQIESLTIPSSFTHFQEGWCNGLQKLTKINIMQNNKNYTLYKNKFILGKSSLEKVNFDVLVFSCRNVEKAIIPDFIEVIGSYAFQYCSKLKYIEISQNSKLKTIKNNAFSYSSIVNFTIPPQITEICDCVFHCCQKLENVEIPDNSKLKKIGISSFSFSGIRQIKIPKNVNQICYMAFANCHNLKRIEFNPDSELQKIKEKAFYLSPIQSISLPPKLTKIGTYAFFNYSHIQIIEINEYSQIKNAFKNNLEASLIMIPKKKREHFSHNDDINSRFYDT